jgi:hypothetical protein
MEVGAELKEAVESKDVKKVESTLAKAEEENLKSKGVEKARKYKKKVTAMETKRKSAKESGTLETFDPNTTISPVCVPAPQLTDRVNVRGIQKQLQQMTIYLILSGIEVFLAAYFGIPYTVKLLRDPLSSTEKSFHAPTSYNFFSPPFIWVGFLALILVCIPVHFGPVCMHVPRSLLFALIRRLCSE